MGSTIDTPIAVLRGGEWLLTATEPEAVFTPENVTEEHRLIGRTTEEFAVNEVQPQLDRLEQKDWAVARQLLSRCGELGLLSVDVAEQYGGIQVDKVTSMIVSERMALAASFGAAFGAQAKAFPSVLVIDGAVDLAGISVPRVQIVVVLAALLTMVLLTLIVMKTRLGAAMRAVAEDRDAATLMGINVDRVIVFTFALGGALAGIAGLLYGLVFKQVSFFMGFFLGVKGFGAAVLGGIGNIPGAMLGGYALGLIESLGPALFLEGLDIAAPYQLRDAIAYTMLVMVLIFRPRGLLGERLSTVRA